MSPAAGAGTGAPHRFWTRGRLLCRCAKSARNGRVCVSASAPLCCVSTTCCSLRLASSSVRRRSATCVMFVRVPWHAVSVRCPFTAPFLTPLFLCMGQATCVAVTLSLAEEGTRTPVARSQEQAGADQDTQNRSCSMKPALDSTSRPTKRTQEKVSTFFFNCLTQGEKTSLELFPAAPLAQGWKNFPPCSCAFSSPHSQCRVRP